MTNNISLPANPIADLWRHARLWLGEMLADFAGPEAIARALARGVRDAFRRRLQMLESLVTKLLLIEAAQLSGQPASCRQARAAVCRVVKHRKHVSGLKPALRAEDPARPDTWRVRFHVRVPRLRRRARAAASCPRPRPACEAVRAQASARTLARRFEALRRVIAEPRAAVATLARKLAALGAHAYAAACRIAFWRPRVSNLALAHGHAVVHARDACLVWCDSS